MKSTGTILLVFGVCVGMVVGALVGRVAIWIGGCAGLALLIGLLLGRAHRKQPSASKPDN
ncbi:hypothetical protein JXD38_05845 [candidate division WOR-3 bacterium]|nr:hypothetical protein [candidate division WOR-3 bacterium]